MISALSVNLVMECESTQRHDELCRVGKAVVCVADYGFNGFRIASYASFATWVSQSIPSPYPRHNKLKIQYILPPFRSLAINSSLQTLDSTSKAFDNIPDMPHFVEFSLQLVDLP